VADVLLLRHARAGQRGSGSSDLQRPLDARGLQQAAALVDLLSPLLGDGAEIRTSEARRCRQTIAPLAAALDTPAVIDPALTEGSDVRVLLARLEGGIERPTVWSTHGDVIPELLGMLARRGLDLGSEPRVAKASTWVLRVTDGTVTDAEYLPPPA
jgi:phosphohistidine phosphatase SixA